MIIHEFEQRSLEWHEIRKGKITASIAQTIAANGKGLQNECLEIVQTLFNKKVDESFSNAFVSNKYIDNGVKYEPLVRKIYEQNFNLTVREVGFIEIDEMLGFSPDGLVGGDGLIEIKVRSDNVFFEYLINRELDIKALYQTQMQLLLSGRKWCDVLTYNPNFETNLLIERILPDEQIFKKLETGIKSAKEIITNLKNKYIGGLKK